MGLPKRLKSKKIIFALGAVAVILVGFFLLRFMTSSSNEVTPEKERPTPRADKPTPKPKKEETPAQSPLFQALKEWKDPFRGEDTKYLDLQSKIDATKKEIEWLKASLEERKLKQEIKELEKTIGEVVQPVIPSQESESRDTGSEEGEAVNAEISRPITVQAILLTDEEKSALLVSGDRKQWVYEGEEFDGWMVKEIRADSVVLSKSGKTCVFYHDHSSVVN